MAMKVPVEDNDDVRAMVVAVLPPQTGGSH
jgi:hypothetical protein